MSYSNHRSSYITLLAVGPKCWMGPLYWWELLLALLERVLLKTAGQPGLPQLLTCLLWGTPLVHQFGGDIVELTYLPDVVSIGSEGLLVTLHIKLLRKLILHGELLLCFHYKVFLLMIASVLGSQDLKGSFHINFCTHWILVEMCRAMSGRHIGPAVLMMHLCSAV